MEIEELRREIDRVDDVIAELIGRRLEVAKRIADAKISKGMPITDLEREAEVILNWRSRLARYGVPSDIATSIAQALIKASKVVQLKRASSLVEHYRVCIVGYGAMARTLAYAFSREGHSVMITGRNMDRARALSEELGVQAESVPKALQSCDYVILTLPIEAFRDGYVDSIAVYMKGRVVMDILSTKASVYRRIEEMSKSIGFNYVSAHPLFGPYTSPEGEKVVLIPSETGVSVVDSVSRLWISIGVEPVIATIEEHEKAMALVQVLTHFVLLTYSIALDRLSRELGVDLHKFSTATFRDVVNVVERLKRICRSVEEIQRENPYSQTIRRSFLDVVADLLDLRGVGLCYSS